MPEALSTAPRRPLPGQARASEKQMARKKPKDRPMKLCQRTGCATHFRQYRPAQRFCCEGCKNRHHAAERSQLVALAKQVQEGR